MQASAARPSPATMTYYERALPHWQPEGAAIFLTWRLHGSLPKEYFESHRDPNPAREFVRQDRILDKAQSGPTWLKDDRVAGCVAAALHHADAVLKLYDLRAWVIMSNHVPVFVDPHVPLASINRSVRAYTARRGESHFAALGAVLAARVLRSLVARSAAIGEDHRLYRREPRECGSGAATRGLPVVQRLRVIGELALACTRRSLMPPRT